MRPLQGRWAEDLRQGVPLLASAFFRLLVSSIRALQANSRELLVRRYSAHGIASPETNGCEPDQSLLHPAEGCNDLITIIGAATS